MSLELLGKGYEACTGIGGFAYVMSKASVYVSSEYDFCKCPFGTVVALDRCTLAHPSKRPYCLAPPSPTPYVLSLDIWLLVGTCQNYRIRGIGALICLLALCS